MRPLSCFVMLLAMAKIAAYAQTPGPRPGVDLSGIYESAVFVGVPDVSQPEVYPFTAAGKRAFDNYDETTGDPRLADDCAAETMPGVLWTGNPMQITQEDDRVVILYERGNTMREIRLDDGSPPEDAPPRELGYSVGRWAGDVLTIETTRLSSGSIFNNGGYAISPEARVTERYWRNAGDLNLQMRLVVDDPVNYTEPFELGREWIWAPDEQIRPWVCVDLGPRDVEPDLDELTRILEEL
jgi:hypothetical protein